MALAKEAATRAHDRDVTVAWTTAALSRLEKLPKLDTLLRERRQVQTAKAHKKVLGQLSEQYGIPLRKISLKTATNLRLARPAA